MFDRSDLLSGWDGTERESVGFFRDRSTKGDEGRLRTEDGGLVSPRSGCTGTHRTGRRTEILITHVNNRARRGDGENRVRVTDGVLLCFVLPALPKYVNTPNLLTYMRFKNVVVDHGPHRSVHLTTGATTLCREM